MIYDEISNLRRYLGIHKNLDTAIQFLLSCEPEKISCGRSVIDGDNVFINRFGYETVPEEETSYEMHRDYADIHIIVRGEEIIDVAAPGCPERQNCDSAGEVSGFRGKAESSCHMSRDKFLIVFPFEAHMSKVRCGESVRVEKAVLKVKM
ncbi:MAG: YhcH/YjgK/YiaL family protein [Candidatus Limivicinus sp.]|jgi:biofilm protein TabA